MIRDDIIKVKTCVLRVSMHCTGCEKKVKRILRKIDGVYQMSIASEGRVTVTGLMDPEAVVKKLNKRGMRTQLWGANPAVAIASQVEKLQLGGSVAGGAKQGQQPNGGAGAASSSGGGGDARMVMPAQPTPQQLQHLQQQMLMRGMKLPPQLMGMAGGRMPVPAGAPPPVKVAKAVRFNVPEDDDDDDSEAGDETEAGDDFEDDGDDEEGDMINDMIMKRMAAMPPAAGGGDKKGGNGGKKQVAGGNELPVQIKGIGAGKVKAAGAKVNMGGKNGGGAQPVMNGKQGSAAAAGGGNQPRQAKMGGGIPPPPPQEQQPEGMMVKPPNMMAGAGGSGTGQMGGMPMGHPQMAGNGMPQPGSGSAVLHAVPASGGVVTEAGFYHQGGAGGAIKSGPEMTQAAGNTMAPPQKQHVAMVLPQKHEQQMPMVQHQQQMPMVQHQEHQYIPMVHQQQPQVVVNGHGTCVCNHGHGGAGYQQQQTEYGYDYGGQQQMPYQTYVPRHPDDNFFSDENPNGCSVM